MVAFMKKYVWLVLSFVLLLTLCPIFPAAADISDEGYACYQFEDGMPEGVRLENATGKIQFGGVYGKGLLVTADSGEPKVLLPFFSERNSQKRIQILSLPQSREALLQALPISVVVSSGS